MTELEIAVKAVEIFASRHPRPSSVTAKQAAEMAGRCPQTIAKMIKEGRIRLNALGMIPISEVDRLVG